MSGGGGLAAAVRDALRRVDGPEGTVDLVAADRVRRLEVDARGRARFAVALGPGEPAGLAEAAREAAASVEGVASVSVSLAPRGEREPWSSPEPPDRDGDDGPGGESPVPDAEALRRRPDPGEGDRAGRRDDGEERDGRGPETVRERATGRSLPVVGEGAVEPAGDGEAAGERERRTAARSPSEAPPLEGVARVLAVSSGKGGVGKSTLASNLAAAWAEEGHEVGLLDADVHGPDVPAMFGLDRRPSLEGETLVPPEAHGVKLMSLGFLLDEETPAIVRGPMLQKIVRQFLRQVRWGRLDYLVVDLPPGTGDAPLSLAQLVRLDGGVFVTTPEEVAVDGVRKGVAMFRRLEVPVVGLAENMAGFVCPDCGSRHDVFGAGGGERAASSLELAFLGSVPLDPAVREGTRRGVPAVVGRPDVPGSRALRSVAAGARRGLEELEGAGERPQRS